MKKNKKDDIHEGKTNIFTEYVFNIIYNIIYQKKNILAPSNPHKITVEKRETYLKFKYFSTALYPRSILLYSLVLGAVILINIFNTLLNPTLNNFSLIMGLVGVEISILTAAVVLQQKLDEYQEVRCYLKK